MCAAPFSPHLGECELIQAKTFLGAVLALEEYGRLVEMAEKWSSCLICYNSFSTPQNSHSQKWQWQHNWILFSPWNPAGCSQTSPVLLKTCPTTTMSSTQPASGRNTHESIYNYWSDFSVYYLYILEVCVIHTEFSRGFFSCISVSGLQRICQIIISSCSDFIPMLRGQCGTRSGDVSGCFRWFLVFLHLTHGVFFYTPSEIMESNYF